MKFYNIYPTEEANALWLVMEEAPEGKWCKSAEAREKVEALTKENARLLEALENCSSTLELLLDVYEGQSVGWRGLRVS